MGHAIGGGFLKATTKEAAMREAQADAEEFAYYNSDRQENYSGDYYGNLIFYDRVFDTEDDAMEFFDSLGSYCDGVCMVKEPGKGARTKYAKKVESIRKKRQAFLDNLIEKFKERTSKSIGCKKCGTRITSEVALKNNLHCPNCRNWLVTDSTKEKYAKFDEQIELANKQLAKDTAETGKVRYWCKYEVHC